MLSNIMFTAGEVVPEISQKLIDTGGLEAGKQL